MQHAGASLSYHRPSQQGREEDSILMQQVSTHLSLPPELLKGADQQSSISRGDGCPDLRLPIVGSLISAAHLPQGRCRTPRYVLFLPLDTTSFGGTAPGIRMSGTAAGCVGGGVGAGCSAGAGCCAGGGEGAGAGRGAGAGTGVGSAPASVVGGRVTAACSTGAQGQHAAE